MFKKNIESLTLKNNNYRKVLNTTKYSQLVIMSLLPMEEIGLEKHKYTSQFIKVEGGKAKIIIGDDIYYMKSGDGVVIPPNTYHNVINYSKKMELKIYTIYSGEILHSKNLIEKYKTD